MHYPEVSTCVMPRHSHCIFHGRVDFLNRVVSLYNIRQFLDCFHDMQERELYSYKWLATMWSSNDHEINFYKIYF